jgi:DNA-binding NtrC family response regulator
MRSILIVDDNRAFAENLAEIVSDAELGTVEVADSGERALELIAGKRFDALVTDMRMPKMNGAELIERARQIDPALPVVVISAFSADEQLTIVAHQGVLSVLPKPAPIARLLQLIGRARRGGVVAVVEDEVAFAENIAEALRERGFASILAHTVEETERLRGALCVALVDLRMPGGVDGAALAWIAERFPDVPVIVVTGLRGEVSLPAHIEVLDKPVDTARLLATIESLAARQCRTSAG